MMSELFFTLTDENKNAGHVFIGGGELVLWVGRRKQSDEGDQGSNGRVNQMYQMHYHAYPYYRLLF